MCTKMLILWTILVLGSLLQGAYADSTTAISSTVVNKTDSQQSNIFITATTKIITTSVTSESRATTPAPTSQAAETSSPPNINDTSKDPTSSQQSLSQNKTQGTPSQQPHNSTARNVISNNTSTKNNNHSMTFTSASNTSITQASDSVNNGLEISTVSVTPMTLNSTTTVSANRSSFTTVSATQSSFTTVSATQSSSTTVSETQSSYITVSAAQSSSEIVSATQSSKTTVPVTPNYTTTIEVIHNSTTTLPVPNNYNTTILGIHTTNGNTSENTDSSNAAPVDQETTATTSHKITTINSAKGSQHVNEEGTTQPSTSAISHATNQVSLKNDLRPKKFSRTVAANRNGDKFERLCTQLIEILNVTGNCNMAGREINGVYEYKFIQLIVADSSKDTSKEMQSEDIPKTSIAIVASCGALALILIGFAVYCSYHRLSYRKNQQHLTEELQTVENGYHDNPTLEVMEVQPEMQEKKLALNGEFNDSWIVPLDNIAKDDIPDEEDTHL